MRPPLSLLMFFFHDRAPIDMEVGYFLLRKVALEPAEAARTLHAFPGELEIILAGNGTRSRNTMIAIDRFIDIGRAISATTGQSGCIRWLRSPNTLLQNRSPIERMQQSIAMWDNLLEIALSPNPLSTINRRRLPGQGTARAC